MSAWVMQYKDSRQLLQLYDSRALTNVFEKQTRYLDFRSL